jgi:hypothetical protein
MPSPLPSASSVISVVKLKSMGFAALYPSYDDGTHFSPDLTNVPASRGNSSSTEYS